MIHYILLWVLTTGQGLATGSAIYNNLAACTVAADELHNSVRGYIHVSTVCTKEEQP